LYSSPLQRSLQSRRLSREVGNETSLTALRPHFLIDTQKGTRFEASEETLGILQSLKTFNFDELTTDNESSFQYLYPSLKMFACSPAVVFRACDGPRREKDYDHTVLSRAKKLIVRDFLPEDMKSIIHYIFPDLRTVNMNSRRQRRRPTFSVHMDDSMCHNKSRWR
jgi:hypothetical protein